MNIFKSKKAQLNDVSIATGIIIFLLAVGAILPYIRADLTGNSGSTINTGVPASEMAAAASASTVSIWTVIFSMTKMLVWSFGDINVWVDLILFTPMRITMYFIIARNIWIGGGG